MPPDELIPSGQVRLTLDGLFQSFQGKMQGVALNIVMNDFLHFVLENEEVTTETRIVILEWASEHVYGRKRGR